MVDLNESKKYFKENLNLLIEFRDNINNKANFIDPMRELDWASLTYGWALGKGMTPSEAWEFFHHVKFINDLASTYER